METMKLLLFRLLFPLFISAHGRVQNVSKGSDVILDCPKAVVCFDFVSGCNTSTKELPLQRVLWEKGAEDNILLNGGSVLSKDGMFLDTDNLELLTNGSLLIKNVSQEHAGNYTCQVSYKTDRPQVHFRRGKVHLNVVNESWIQTDNPERKTNTWKTKHTALTAAILGRVVSLVLIVILVTICYRRHKHFKPPKLENNTAYVSWSDVQQRSIKSCSSRPVLYMLGKNDLNCSLKSHNSDRGPLPAIPTDV